MDQVGGYAEQGQKKGAWCLSLDLKLCSKHWIVEGAEDVDGKGIYIQALLG